LYTAFSDKRVYIENTGAVMILRFIVASLVIVFVAGCVPDEQYAAVQDNYRRSENRSRENVKTVAELKLKIDSLEQEKKALKLEIARRDEMLATYRSHLEWAKLIPGAEVSSEGNLILKGDIIFQPGSHELTAQGRSALDEVAKVLSSESPNISTIRIDGHTDSTPIRKTKDKYDSNMELSFMRAYSVYTHLAEKSHVDPARFYIAAFGDTRPRSNDLSDNRRVEILVQPENKQ